MKKARMAVLSGGALALLFTLSPPLAAGNDQGNGAPQTKLTARAQPKNVSKTQGESFGRNRVSTRPQSPPRSASSSFSRRGTPGTYIGDAYQSSMSELLTTSDSRLGRSTAFGSSLSAGRGSSPIGATQHADSMECLPR